MPCPLTSSLKLTQNLLLTYALLPPSTLSLPNSLTSPGGGESFFKIFLARQPPLSRFSRVLRHLFGLSCTAGPEGSTSPSLGGILFRLRTTPSSLLSLAISSASCGFLLRLGALPGPGKIHTLPVFKQLAQGFFLSHRTFLFLQVVQDLGFGGVAAGGELLR